MMLAFTVYGTPQAKGSMRAIRVKGMKFPIVTDSNRSAKSWAQLVAAEASHALNQLQVADRLMLPHAVRLTVRFHMSRPKKYGKRGVFVPHCVAPDVDKLARSVLDALATVLYRDDRQVTELVAGKYYAAVDEAAHVDVRVEAAPGHQLAPLPVDAPLFAGVL